MAGRNSDSGRQAVIWLATSFIILIGAAATAFVILAATREAQDQYFVWLVWGGCFTGLCVVLILISMHWEEPINQLKFWLTYQERNDATDLYRAARRRQEVRDELGGNQPPTIESLRDAAEHGGAWVPRSSGGKQRPRKS